MTLHCWQHWFWITAVIPAILLVLTSPRPSSASAIGLSWETPASVWTSTTWVQSGPPGAPPTWAIQRRLLGFAMPQPLSAAAPGAASGSVTLGIPSPTLAVTTPTAEAILYTLSPQTDDELPNISSVPSADDAQNKSSQSVYTASSPTPAPSPTPTPTLRIPPSKPARPKVFKTYVASMPKTSFAVKPAKLSTSTSSSTSTTTTTTTTTTTVAPVVTPTKSVPTTSTTSANSSSEIPESSTSTEDVIADPPAELMNDGPAEASSAPLTPGSGAAGAVSEATSPSTASPWSSRAPVPVTTATPALVPVSVATEAPHRREQSRDLEIVHPGVSFDNVSKQHALSSNESHGDGDGDGGLDAGSITGIALGVVLFAALVGSASFVLYRRRFLNKPQTLNDKCSNPDSSGYIDDSTLRENSEEMYSLDNDSFLNSLEAMTIQNYWTDSVKHTKL